MVLLGSVLAMVVAAGALALEADGAVDQEVADGGVAGGEEGKANDDTYVDCQKISSEGVCAMGP